MDAIELLNPYQAKAVEYLIAVAYLLLFVPFWRFVNGARPAPALSLAKAVARRVAGWFEIPEGVQLHPGHAWLRPNGLAVTVGVDDFARKLVGPLSAVELPALGAELRQGEKAWRLVADGRGVDMLSPVDGTVVAVNDAGDRQERVADDPYGNGWLLKVVPRDLAHDTRQLLSGEPARQWLEGVASSLRSRLSPELGLVLQDGGQPVHGIAAALDPERWDELAREYLRS